MLERCPLPPRPAILEVGCGTGKLLREAARQAGAGAAVGVDPEPAMRAQATGLDVREGRAERLPLDSGCGDLAFCSLAFHWVSDKPAAAGELWRVLRPGGWAAIWTLTPEHVHGFHLNRYFPSLPAVDLARFEAPELWMAQLAAAGLRPVLEQQLVQTRVTSAGRLAAAVRQRFISTLSLLPEAEFQAGAAELEAEAAGDPSRRVSYPQTWCLIWAARQ